MKVTNRQECGQILIYVVILNIQIISIHMLVNMKDQEVLVSLEEQLNLQMNKTIIMLIRKKIHNIKNNKRRINNMENNISSIKRIRIIMENKRNLQKRRNQNTDKKMQNNKNNQKSKYKKEQD
jgi:hypothetical protein